MDIHARCQPQRVLGDEGADLRCVVAISIVVEPALAVFILPLQPERVVHLIDLQLRDAAPGLVARSPLDVAGAVDQAYRAAVGVVDVVEGWAIGATQQDQRLEGFRAIDEFTGCSVGCVERQRVTVPAESGVRSGGFLPEAPAQRVVGVAGGAALAVGAAAVAGDQALVGVPFEFEEAVGALPVGEVAGAVEAVAGAFNLRRLPPTKASSSSQHEKPSSGFQFEAFSNSCKPIA